MDSACFWPGFKKAYWPRNVCKGMDGMDAVPPWKMLNIDLNHMDAKLQLALRHSPAQHRHRLTLGLRVKWCQCLARASASSKHSQSLLTYWILQIFKLKWQTKGQPAAKQASQLQSRPASCKAGQPAAKQPSQSERPACQTAQISERGTLPPPNCKRTSGHCQATSWLGDLVTRDWH